jgi:hypothetical protein
MAVPIEPVPVNSFILLPRISETVDMIEFYDEMKSAIALLTYRRVNALRLSLEQIKQHCPETPIAVFEDCGQTDGTEEYLLTGAKFVRRDLVYEADVYENDGVTIFLAHSNSGVTAGSNKAIKWFMEETEADHLCLCNDDILVSGPFHKTYGNAHEKLGIGLLCMCNFTSDAYKWANVKAKGITVKLLSRMTGIMMSLTRSLVDCIGYYDANIGVFGQEHCEYTNRARLKGFVSLNGQQQYCLDIHCAYITHQEVESSLTPNEKNRHNAVADVMVEELARSYSYADLYRPYSTGGWDRVVAARDGTGISLACLENRSKIKDSQLDGCPPLPPFIQVSAEATSTP